MDLNTKQNMGLQIQKMQVNYKTNRQNTGA